MKKTIIIFLLTLTLIGCSGPDRPSNDFSEEVKIKYCIASLIDKHECPDGINIDGNDYQKYTIIQLLDVYYKMGLSSEPLIEVIDRYWDISLAVVDKKNTNRDEMNDAIRAYLNQGATSNKPSLGKNVKKLIEESKERVIKKDNYVCISCGQVFPSHEEALRHMKTHKPPTMIIKEGVVKEASIATCPRKDYDRIMAEPVKEESNVTTDGFFGYDFNGIKFHKAK